MQASAARALAAAFEEHHVGLERRLAVVTRSESVGQELAQEAFYRLGRELDRGRSPDDVGAWLHRVGRNLAVSRGRHLQVVERRWNALPRPAEPPLPELLAIDAERRARVHSMLVELTATERRAIAFAAEGIGGPDMAAAMGRSPNATRTLLCRARAKLRTRLLEAESRA